MMDLENLDKYGIDELKGALGQIFEAFSQKMYDRGFAKGQDAPLDWHNKPIPYTTISGQDYVTLNWLLAELQAAPSRSAE